MNSMKIVIKYQRKIASSHFCLQTAYKCLSDQFNQSSPSVLVGEGSGSADLASSYAESTFRAPNNKERALSCSSGHMDTEMQAQKHADFRQNFLSNWMLTERGAKATDTCHFFVSRGVSASPVAY